MYAQGDTHLYLYKNVLMMRSKALFFLYPPGIFLREAKKVFRVLQSLYLQFPLWILRRFYVFPFLLQFARVFRRALALLYAHTFRLVWSRVFGCRRRLAFLPDGKRNILQDIPRTLTTIFAHKFTRGPVTHHVYAPSAGIRDFNW